MSSSDTTTTPPSDPKLSDLWKKGIETRREVVGDTFVDTALANGSTAFSAPGQHLVTEFCWGWAWNRPGLSRRDRSLLNIAMLMALNRSTELGAHVRGARNNGCSEEEIRETILHATIYCGVPSGVEGMRVAERVLNEMEKNGEAKRELGGKVDINTLEPQG